MNRQQHLRRWRGALVLVGVLALPVGGQATPVFLRVDDVPDVWSAMVDRPLVSQDDLRSVEPAVETTDNPFPRLAEVTSSPWPTEGRVRPTEPEQVQRPVSEAQVPEVGSGWIAIGGLLLVYGWRRPWAARC